MIEHETAGIVRFHPPTVSRLVRMDEWCQTASPPTLVAGVLPQASFGVIYGPSGAGKTFVALEMAAVIALGLTWHGHRVRQGPVVYVAAEGQEGLKKRLLALMKHRGLTEIPDLVSLDCAINLGNGASVDELLRDIDQLETAPKLVIIDTFGQCYSGDENNHEVAAPLHQINRLRDRGMSVVLIHHSTKGKPGDERGSTRIKAAADVMINVQQTRGCIEVSCAKSKDFEPFAPMLFQLLSVDLGLSCEGEQESSAVLDPASGLAASPTSSTRESAVDDACLAALRISTVPLKSGDWAALVNDPHGGAPISRHVFQKSRQRLVEAGLVKDLGKSRYEAAK